MTSLGLSVMMDVIEEQPGISEIGLIDVATARRRNLGGIRQAALAELGVRGYRHVCRGWWPSRARCAELARTATGDRREALLRGMLL